MTYLCLPCQDVKDLVVTLIAHNGTVTFWQSFGDLELEPLVHHMQSPVAAASVCCHAKRSSWQAAVALQSSAVLLLKPAGQLSAMQTIAIGSLCKGIEVGKQFAHCKPAVGHLLSIKGHLVTLLPHQKVPSSSRPHARSRFSAAYVWHVAMLACT